MDHEVFFATIEEKLQVSISERIKAHMKFHNMDNFIVASTLNEQSIKEIEEFARSTLHQVLDPEEMVQFYGSHFLMNPELFVFTLGERLHLSGLKQVCQEICDGNQEKPEDDMECDMNTPTDITNNSKQSDKQIIAEKTVKRERGEIMRYSVPDAALKLPRETITMICLKNLHRDTSDKELTNLAETFGPLRWKFLSKDKDSESCKGFGVIDFKYRNDAAKAIEILNGCKFKENILIAEWWNPKPRKRVPINDLSHK